MIGDGKGRPGWIATAAAGVVESVLTSTVKGTFADAARGWISSTVCDWVKKCTGFKTQPCLSGQSAQGADPPVPSSSSSSSVAAPVAATPLPVEDVKGPGDASSGFRCWSLKRMRRIGGMRLMRAKVLSRRVLFQTERSPFKVPGKTTVFGNWNTLGDQLWKQQRGTWTIMWCCLPTYVVVLAESVPVPVSVEDAQGPFSREEVLRDVSYPQDLWQCCRVPCRVFWWQERAADEFLESLSRRQARDCLWSLLARWSLLHTIAFLFKSIHDVFKRFFLATCQSWLDEKVQGCGPLHLVLTVFNLAFSSAKGPLHVVSVSRGSLWRRLRLLTVPWVGFFLGFGWVGGWVGVGVGACACSQGFLVSSFCVVRASREQFDQMFRD